MYDEKADVRVERIERGKSGKFSSYKDGYDESRYKDGYDDTKKKGKSGKTGKSSSRSRGKQSPSSSSRNWYETSTVTAHAAHVASNKQIGGGGGGAQRVARALLHPPKTAVWQLPSPNEKCKSAMGTVRGFRRCLPRMATVSFHGCRPMSHIFGRRGSGIGPSVRGC